MCRAMLPSQKIGLSDLVAALGLATTSSLARPERRKKYADPQNPGAEGSRRAQPAGFRHAVWMISPSGLVGSGACPKRKIASVR